MASRERIKRLVPTARVLLGIVASLLAVSQVDAQHKLGDPLSQHRRSTPTLDRHLTDADFHAIMAAGVSTDSEPQSSNLLTVDLEESSSEK